MAKVYKRKKSSYWFAEFKGPNNQRIRRSTQIPSEEKLKQQALLKAQQMELDEWNGWHPNKKEEPEFLFDNIVVEYIKRKKPNSADINCIKQLRKFFGELSYSKMDGEDISDYIEHRREAGISDSTIRRELATFSSAVNFCRRTLDWPINNIIEGRKPTQSEGVIRFATIDEAQALIRTAKDHKSATHMQDFIELGLNTGMRKLEILSLRRDQIDLRNKVIHLAVNEQKGRKNSTIPLNQIAQKVIMRRMTWVAENLHGEEWAKQYLFPNPKTKSHIKDIKTSWKEICEKAGVKSFRPHDLRHTFASWLVQMDVPIRKVQELMRHSSVTETEKYSHLAPKHTADTVDVLAHIWHTDKTTKVLPLSNSEKVQVN